MSPTDFTDSHGLLVRVCLNLPQISQILTDCWCAFVLIFYDFTDSVFFGGFPYLCKSVQSVGVFLSYAICGNFLSCVISGRIPQEYLPQISQILTDCWCAFVLIFYDFTDSVFFGGFPYLCKSVQSVGVFLSYAICESFLSCAISGTFLSCAISGRNSLFRVSVYLAVYLIIYIVGVEIDEYT